MNLSKYNIITENEAGEKILFNSMSGAVFKLNSDYESILKANRILDLSDSEIDIFKKNGVIVDDSEQQLRQYDYEHNLFKYDDSLLSITWLTTWGCNLECTYCFEGDKKNTKIVSNKSDIDKMLLFIENEHSKHHFKYLALTLFGGEPMVNYKGIKYSLPKIKEFCDDHEIILGINMVSNGLLLNEKNLNFMIENDLKMIQITLDGPQQLHDQKRIYPNGKSTFNRIIEKLEFLRDNFPLLTICIRINVDKENYPYIEDLLAFLKKRNLLMMTIDFGIIRDEATSCGNISNICYPDEELGKILYSLWLSAAKKGLSMRTVPAKRYTYCGLNREHSYTFSPEMNFYKCWEHLGDEEHNFGILNERGEIEITNPNYYDWMSKNPTAIYECAECKYLGSCGGGCSVNSYNQSGTYNSAGCYQVKGVIEKQLVFSLNNNQI
ncbi:radical SAM/SPASM domain-containing protein [Candidatus Enterococcus courvalinii]|uniref:SPASM domain-containing protein n=1 Tax=Candidatus Enterococcus courvalinii TaxID=2815329 RepID=A0ABS3I0K2_9ENTE|nr:radical SAM protein [Enterococcus sp. MSG2901]MBO0482196.1 SPASM domain-containing protein [Enterococcus sp. MSG2901]